MARRQQDIATLCCPATSLEVCTVAQMRAACGATSDANLIRIALWSLADHMGIDPPSGVFDCRTPGAMKGAPSHNPKRATPGSKIRQDRPFVRRGATDAHPWRGLCERTAPVLEGLD